MTAEQSPPPPPRWFLVALTLLAVGGFVFFQYATWRQWVGCCVRGDAPQSFDIMLSRFARGEGMVRPHTGNHFFTNHVMLWLYPLGWAYKVVDSIWTYMTALNLGLAAAAVPLGLLAFRVTGVAALSLLTALLFLFNPLTCSLLWSLHPESLLPLGWFLVFLGVESKSRRTLIAGVIAICLVKEDSPLWLTIFAAWAFWFRRMPRREAVILGVAAVGLTVLFQIVMRVIPLNGTDRDTGLWWLSRYGEEVNGFGALVQWFGSNALVIVQRIVTSNIWPVMLVTGGVLCLFGWRELLLLLPPAIMLLSADSSNFGDVSYYYCYPLIPPLFLALIAGMRWVLEREKLPVLETPKSRIVATATVVSACLIGGLFIPTRVDGWTQSPWQFPDRSVEMRFVRSIFRDNGGPRPIPIHYEYNAWVPHGWCIEMLRPAHLDTATEMILDRKLVSSDVGREEYERFVDRLNDPALGWEPEESFGSVLYFRRKAP